MSQNMVDVLRWLVDSLVVLWFILPMEGGTRSRRVLRGGGIALCLLANLVLYPSDWAALGVVSRFCYRVGMYALCFRLSRRLRWDWCAYYALLLWLVFNICSHTFLASALYLGSEPLSEGVAEVLLFGLLRVAVLAVISWRIPFAYAEKPGVLRFAFVCFLSGVQLYIRFTQRYISAESYGEARIYLILLQVLLGAALVFFERFLYTRQLSEQERLASAAIRYRYENAKAQQEAEDDLRRIHHDMKNHLLVIRNLVHDDQRVDGYINSLMSGLGAYEHRADTGNKLLDDLLAAKMRSAAQQDIQLDVQVDFRPCAYMEDMDVCCIFGNILDNALEAAGSVEDPQQRSILLKSTRAAGQLILTCSNYYAGELRLSGGLPRTTKSDRAHHGIGLSSVRRSVETYGGVLSLRTTPDRRLSLTILLPLEAHQPPGPC